jgi:hypothetical protein
MHPVTFNEPQQGLMKHDHPPLALLVPRFLSNGVVPRACGLAILCASVATAADREPSYNGRLLSEWLADQYASSGVTVAGAPNPPKEAVRAMGTNAIPTLLKWISYEGPAPEPSVPEWRRHPLSRKELAESTMSAFGFLGPVACPAIPELSRLARTSSDPKRAERCAVSLAAIGPEAIPSLISLATSGPPSARYAGAFGLEYFARRPEGVQTLPTLIACLADTNTQVAGSAQLSLIYMGPAVTMPALTNALHSSSAQTRLLALGCLLIFKDEEPSLVPAVVPFFRAAMRDPDYQVRDMATNTLRHMGGWELVGERWVRRHDTNTPNGITPDFFTNAPPR